LFTGATARTVSSFVTSYAQGGPWVLPNGLKVTGNSAGFCRPGVGVSFTGRDPGWAPLISRALGQIKHQNVNLAQALAERKQTSDLFVSASRDILKVWRSLRGGRSFADFVRLLKNPQGRSEKRLADEWLRYQYGMKPLMQDIYGSAESLATKIQKGFDQYLTLHDTYTDTASGTYFDTYFGCTVASTRIITTKKTLRVRYRVSDTALKQISALGFTNPAQLAWELIPYSFVVDWFIPVGNYLSNWDSLVGTSGVVANGGFYRETIDIGSSCGCENRTRFQEWVRIPGIAMTNPVPHFKNPVSSTHVANALALLRGMRK
jgi:hypothetical protein